MTFEVRPFEARTVSWWYRVRDEIDFAPPYQRTGQVWDDARQGFLIDSILNDFDIPKLYFADFTYFRSPLNRTSRRFAVIDGKQRLTALFRFLEDELPLAPDFVLRDEPEADLAGLTLSELRSTAPDLASKVENFNLPVMSVITDDEGAVQELFVRLNSGKPLTAAERRNAFPGLVPGLVREIASSQFFEQCVAFAPRGGAREQAAAKLLLLEVIKDPVDLKRSNLDNLYRLGPTIYGDEFLSAAATDVLEVLDEMSKHFAPRDPLLRTQGQVPVYYLLFRQGSLADAVRAQIEAFHRYRRLISAFDAGAAGEEDAPLWIGPPVRRYNKLLRNPNDARSIFEMVDILRWFVDTRPLLDFEGGPDS